MSRTGHMLVLLAIIAFVACWFRGCETHHHLYVEVIPPDNVRPIPAFKPMPRVKLRETTPETL